MSRTPAGRVLPLVYFLLLGAVALLLAVLGFVLDRVPLIPATVGRGYQLALLGLLSTLSTPLDGWADRWSDAPVGEPTAESSP